MSSDTTPDSNTVVISMSATKELLSQLDEVITLRGYHSRSQALRDAITDFLNKYHLSTTPSDTGIISIIVRLEDPVAFDAGFAEVLQDTELEVLVLARKVDNDVSIRLIQANGNLSEISALLGKTRAISGVHSVEFSLLSL